MTAAGWYQDPADEGCIRYWDGVAWSTTTAPKPTPVPAPAPAPALVPSPATSRPDPYAQFAAPATYGYDNRPVADHTIVLTGRSGAIATRGILIGVGVIFALAGLGTIGLSTVTTTLFDSLEPHAGSTMVVGTVVEIQVDTMTDSETHQVSPTCRPVAEFTVDGQTYTAMSVAWIGHTVAAGCRWTVGGTADIGYLPDDIAGTARVSTKDDVSETFMSGFSMVFIGGGVFAILIGALLMFAGIKGKIVER